MQMQTHNNNSAREDLNPYLGPKCVHLHERIVVVSGRCLHHVKEYHEMGGDDWDYHGGGDSD